VPSTVRLVNSAGRFTMESIFGRTSVLAPAFGELGLISENSAVRSASVVEAWGGDSSLRSGGTAVTRTFTPWYGSIQRQPINLESLTPRFKALGYNKLQYNFRKPNVFFSPNKKIVDLMATDKFKALLSNEIIDCSEIAQILFDASGGKGKIITIKPNEIIGGKVNIGERTAALNLEIREYDYHTIFRDDRYVYDPRLSSDPIPRGDFQSIINKLNPEGVKMHNGDPWTQSLVERRGKLTMKIGTL
jgi:hypothetical protein